jgi:hypothetical protein
MAPRSISNLYDAPPALSNCVYGVSLSLPAVEGRPLHSYNSVPKNGIWIKRHDLPKNHVQKRFVQPRTTTPRPTPTTPRSRVETNLAIAANPAPVLVAFPSELLLAGHPTPIAHSPCRPWAQGCCHLRLSLASRRLASNCLPRVILTTRRPGPNSHGDGYCSKSPQRPETSRFGRKIV